MGMKTRLLVLLTVIIAFPLHAEEDDERWYDIEVIILEHDHQPARMTEIWPADPGTPDYSQAMVLAPAPLPDISADALAGSVPQGLPDEMPGAALDATPAATGNGADDVIPLLDESTTEDQATLPPGATAYQMLAAAEMQLLDAYQRLVAASGYRPLMHFAWRQPVLQPEQAQPVLIYRDMLDEGEGPVLDDLQLLDEGGSGDSPLPGSAAATPAAITRDPLMVPDSHNMRSGNIEGTITVSAGKYLHLDLDLLYFVRSQQPRGPLALFASNDDLLDVYRLRQHRRVRSNEVHYFDHPMFGAMVVVRPYEAPGNNDETPSAR